MQTVYLSFSLRHPDMVSLADWQRDPEFSPEAHERLLAAHERIREASDSLDALREVEAELLRISAGPMSRRQRMLLDYLLAHCERARDLTKPQSFNRAQEWLTRTEDIAQSLQDIGAQVDVHELKGTLYRAVSMYREAADEFAIGLSLLREHAKDQESFDPDFEATLAAKTATMDYMLGDFPRALERLHRAADLLPPEGVSISSQGTIAWAFALLNRQRNVPLEALWHVSVAVDLYRQIGSINSTCRVLSLAADIAMDAAESSAGDDPKQREAYLDLAARYAQEASAVGAIAKDKPGIALTDLSLARLDRLRNPAGAADVELRIRRILRKAQRMRDDSLRVAAQIALGADLLTQGTYAPDKRELGKRWLRIAIATANDMHAPGLALRARRLLRQADGRSS